MGIATCTIQGVLQIGEKFVAAEKPEHGLNGSPAHFVQVYYLQLPLPLGRQLEAQGIDLKSVKDFEESDFYTQMIDVGWPSNDSRYNPFGFNKNIGRKLKVTGQAFPPYHGFSSYLSPIFLNVRKVEVIKEFEKAGW